MAWILAVGLLARLSAADALKFESELYVFLDAEFTSIALGNGASIASGHGQVFSTPAALKFDEHVLRLADGERIWNERETRAPRPFSPVAVPTMVLAEGQRGSVLCAMPMEYMEKMPDGSLQLRRIERDSPEAPHYKLTFEGRIPDSAGHADVSCRLEVATVSGRERIPGIELDIGKPILARFEQNFQLSAAAGGWSGFLLRRPLGGDYGLLLLLKVTPQAAGGMVSSTDAMLEEELHHFTSYYYRNPRPDQVERAIEGVGVAGGEFLRQWDYRFVGFFAEIFANNPERLPAWRKVIGRQSPAVRSIFRPALRLDRPGALLATKEHSVKHNSMYWGAYCATGNPAYLRKLVDQLALLEDDRVERFTAGSDAMRSLSWNADQHPFVRPTLEAYRRGADPRTRELITDLLQKGPAEINEQLITLRMSRSFRRPRDLRFGPGLTAPPSDRGVGADAGRPPPSSTVTPVPFWRN